MNMLLFEQSSGALDYLLTVVFTLPSPSSVKIITYHGLDVTLSFP